MMHEFTCFENGGGNTILKWKAQWLHLHLVTRLYPRKRDKQSIRARTIPLTRTEPDQENRSEGSIEQNDSNAQWIC